jgi:hypothetical protein
MKTKTLFTIMLLTCVVILFANWRKNYFIIPIKQDKIKAATFQPVKISMEYGINVEEKEITCKGLVFDKYPTLDSIKNKDLLELFKSLPQLNIEESYRRVANPPLSSEMADLLFNHTKTEIFSSYGYVNYFLRVDGEKLEWVPIALLPTNGRFIMLILTNRESRSYDPSSNGFFLCTFKLTGEMQSIEYIYGHEEINRSNQNKEILTGFEGRAYCLNTNKPVVRKAILWDEYINRNGYLGCTLEIKEFNYLIDEHGFISIESEKIIFPKKHMQWKDRQGVSFSGESDTVKKMLGEIK